MALVMIDGSINFSPPSWPY